MTKAKDLKADLIIDSLNKKLTPFSKNSKGSGNNHPIFVVGLPRSGTTVLEQVCLHVFKLAYIDNISAKFWNAPEYGVALSSSIVPFEERRQASFESNFGFIEEVFGRMNLAISGEDSLITLKVITKWTRLLKPKTKGHFGRSLII